MNMWPGIKNSVWFNKPLYLMVSVDKADCCRHGDNRRLKGLRHSTPQVNFTTHLREVTDAEKQRFRAILRLIQHFQDLVHWRQIRHTIKIKNKANSLQ